MQESISGAYDHLLEAFNLSDFPASWFTQAGFLCILRKDYHQANKYYKQALEPLEIAEEPKATLDPYECAEHGYVKIKLSDYKAAHELLEKGCANTAKDSIPLNYPILLALVKLKLNKIAEGHTLLKALAGSIDEDTKTLKENWVTQTVIGRIPPHLSIPPEEFADLMLNNLPVIERYDDRYSLTKSPQKLEWYALAIALKNYLDNKPEIQALLKEKK